LKTTSFRPERDPDVAAWYARYSARLRGVARRITGNESDAEDALHDAFVAAFRARRRYQHALDPYPWLYRIATRKALTIAGARRPLLVDSGLDALRAVPSAEDEAFARAESYRLRTLLAAERATGLHLVNGLRFRDVSAVLGIPAATAATQIRRGKQRLRAALAATPSKVRESKTA
jgi:RNA polymerase sigma-70 factor (ECF subfamily)